MKQLFFVLITILCMSFTSRAQNNVGISDNNSNSDPSAMLDVNSSSKGLLIPRVSLTSTADITTIAVPASSLMVYNTATTADVFPGYYYWEGTKWVRIQSIGNSIQNLATVTKTANGSIAKTNNMVFASGDITLTLPVVTSADNGLQICVKNSGTYMDVVTITGATGTEYIDATLSSALYKNWGRTYIAKDGNWTRMEITGRSQNVFDVSSESSWTTIAEAIEFLGSHMTGPSVIRLGGGIYNISATQTINLPFPLTIEGGSIGVSEIVCPTGSTAFNVQSNCHFNMLVFKGNASAIGIQFSGSGVSFVIKNSHFKDFTKAINITNSADLWLFESIFENCTTSGVDIATGAANISFRISECTFKNCAMGINMASYGSGSLFSVLSCTFNNNSVGQTGIFYVPGSSSPSVSAMNIQGNSFNNIGTFATGFDFSRPDGRDAEISMDGNSGFPSQRPHCKFNVVNNLTTTTISTANTWYRLNNFTDFNIFTAKWTVANNRITYQPKNIRDAVAFISGNIGCNNSNRIINIAIVKNSAAISQTNPTRYGETSVRIANNSSNYSFQFSLNAYLPALLAGDYFELWVTSNTAGDILTIDNLNWFTDTY